MTVLQEAVAAVTVMETELACGAWLLEAVAAVTVMETELACGAWLLYCIEHVLGCYHSPVSPTQTSVCAGADPGGSLGSDKPPPLRDKEFF